MAREISIHQVKSSKPDDLSKGRSIFTFQTPSADGLTAVSIPTPETLPQELSRIVVRVTRTPIREGSEACYIKAELVPSSQT